MKKEQGGEKPEDGECSKTNWKTLGLYPMVRMAFGMKSLRGKMISPPLNLLIYRLGITMQGNSSVNATILSRVESKI